jgi:hypothetical protein
MFIQNNSYKTRLLLLLLLCWDVLCWLLGFFVSIFLKLYAGISLHASCIREERTQSRRKLWDSLRKCLTYCQTAVRWRRKYNWWLRKKKTIYKRLTDDPFWNITDKDLKNPVLYMEELEKIWDKTGFYNQIEVNKNQMDILEVKNTILDIMPTDTWKSKCY